MLFHLTYSSFAKMAEYRDSPAAIWPNATVIYDLVPAAIALPARLGNVQARFRNHVFFEPRFTLKGNVRVKAVIDRMMILLVTHVKTSWNGIAALLEEDGGRVPFVSDREGYSGDIDWYGGIELPIEMRAGYGPGRVFAIMFQEPTPEKLTRALTEIAGKFGS